jgi:hypothetical protein
MEEQFVSIVEQATGRRVRAFLSETNLKEDISVEVFILAEARTDMSDFEEASGEGGLGASDLGSRTGRVSACQAYEARPRARPAISGRGELPDNAHAG